MMMKFFGLRKIACAAPLLFAVCSTAVLAQQITGTDKKSVKTDLHVVVKPGDTLTSIVNREMGSVEFWPKVVEINKLTTPNSLMPGEIIIFPWELLELRNFARILFFKGDVTLQRKDGSAMSVIEKGDKIYAGDVIRTGEDGFVSLTFNGDSLVNIQPESHMKLNELKCFDKEIACQIEINTTSGQMKLNINNVGFAKPTKFMIDTPYATAAVRGTVFDFATADGNILGVTEGEVQISANNRSISIPIGKGTLAGEGRSVSVLYDLLAKPEFNDFLRISPQDYISWNAVADAASYKVVFAGSESMSDVIQSASGQQLLVAAMPEPGRYFVSIRAIAKNGLKGFISKQQIDQVKVDEKIPAPELDIELIGDALTVKASGRYPAEVHIGDNLMLVDEVETLVKFNSYDIAPGKSFSVTVDPSQDIYLTSRAVISQSTVSAYGKMYELKKAAK